MASQCEGRVFTIFLWIRVNSWLTSEGWRSRVVIIQNGRHSKCFSPKCQRNNNLVTQWEVAAPLSLDNQLAWGLNPPSTHSEPGLAPRSQLPQGASKKKRLGAPDSHSSLPCIFRTSWPPLAWALTNSRLCSWWISAELGMWGKGALGTGALLNHSDTHSTAGGVECPFAKGSLELTG